MLFKTSRQHWCFSVQTLLPNEFYKLFYSQVYYHSFFIFSRNKHMLLFFGVLHVDYPDARRQGVLNQILSSVNETLLDIHTSQRCDKPCPGDCLVSSHLVLLRTITTSKRDNGVREDKSGDSVVTAIYKLVGSWPCDKGSLHWLGPLSHCHDPARF